MALDLSGLSAYVDEQKLPLIKRSILGSRAMNFLTVQPDIKSSATINILDSTLVAQAGACGWSPSGTTALTQQELKVCPIKVNEGICLDDLEKYYTQKMMNPGSYNENIPFEQLYAEDKADRIAALVEDLAFKGNTVSGSGNLALCDGFLKRIDVDFSASTVNGNVTSASAITASNIVALVDGMVASVPADIIDATDLVLFMGYDTYRTYALALRNANLFHYNGQENQGQDFSQMVPGTNVRVIAVRGLNGTNRMILSRSANMYVGTDLLNDFEDFKIKYDDVEDDVKFRAKWKQGVQFAFPEFVVNFRLV
jgi:hypothetical protein